MQELFYSENKGAQDPWPKYYKRFFVTSYQRARLEVLLQGGFVAYWMNGKYRVWDNKRRPIHRLSVSGFLKIKKFLRRKENGYVIDYRVVRSLRKNCWIKERYLQLRKK